MSCRCSEFEPLELRRSKISKRASETKALSVDLELVAHDDECHASLWKCPVCEQMWQSGQVSVWRGREYFFQVPPISLEEWRREQYAAPAALLNFAAFIQGFVDKNCDQETERICPTEGCGRHVIRLSKYCLVHHIEAMQKARLLPEMPGGRLFAPYEWVGDLPKYLEEVSR